MTPASNDLDRFRGAVQRRTADTPYTVTPTDTGFDVGLDVVDARWFGLYGAAGLHRTFVHHVAVGAGYYRVTDDSRTMRWEAGVPRLSRATERFVGRKLQFGTAKIWAPGLDGRLEKVVDYTFSSEEGRGLITDAAREIGLTQRQPLSVRIGTTVAIVAVVLVVLGVLVDLLR